MKGDVVEARRVLRLRRSVVFVPFDFAAAWLAALAAPGVRHFFDPAGPEGIAAAAARPMLEPLAAAALWCAAFAWVGLYRPVHRVSAGDVLVGVLRGAPAGLALVVVATFFTVRHPLFLPARSLPPIQALLAVPLAVAGRLMGLALLAALARAGWGRSRVVVIGTGEAAADTVALLSREGLLGSELLGHVRVRAAAPAPSTGQPVIGDLMDLADLIGERTIDRVVVAEELSGPELRTISLLCERLGVELGRTAELALAGRLDLVPGATGELPVVRVARASPNRLALLVKRLVDTAIALSLLLVLSPLLVVVVVALWIEGGRPLLTQPRIGRGGRPFAMFKFRSMRATGERHAEAWDGHLWKDPDDPRVTRLGRLLRRFSIDELPQLLNVLLGQMSLVGPRPLLASDLGPDGHSPRYPAWSEVRSRMLPGITGLWQVRGRNDLSFEDMMRLDIFYCEQWSLALDLAILLRTGPAVMRGRGAY